MMETVQNLSSGNAPYARARRFPQPYTGGRDRERLEMAGVSC
jgi:hypothetical protein